MSQTLRVGVSRACLLGLAVAFAGCSTGNAVTKKPEAAGRTPVKTVAVTQTEVKRTTTQPATVHAYYRAEIRAMASGYVKHLAADIGDYVEAGATLAVIDVPEMEKQRQIIEARLRRLEAEEQRATASIHLAAAEVRSSQASLAEAKSLMSRADALLAAAEAEFTRTQDLVQRQSLQDRMLDEARKKRDSEAAGKEAVASSIQSAEAKVAVAEAQQASAETDLVAARADTEIARRQLEELDVLIGYATVRAPFEGIVTRRAVEPGDLVRDSSEVGSGEPLFLVSQVDRVRVRIPVPEADALLVNKGDEVTLTFPSFSAETPIQGTVTRLSGSLDPSTRTMLVEADIPNTDGKLVPGMFGQASIALATKVAANVLPSRAVRFSAEGAAYVYVVGEDETVTIAEITTGLDDGKSIEVVSGVEPGQEVIDSHLKRFTDGQKVGVLDK